jgi:hypothetical protein
MADLSSKSLVTLPFFVHLSHLRSHFLLSRDAPRFCGVIESGIDVPPLMDLSHRRFGILPGKCFGFGQFF